MIWKIALCDDSAAERQNLAGLLEHYAEERELTLQCYPYPSGSSLISAHEDEGLCFELILLDVLMGELGGIETALRLRRGGVQTPLVFVTTSRDYAVESYDVDAAGYLLKPVAYKKLFSLLDRLLKRPEQPRLALHIRGGIRFQYYSDILFFESRDHATFAVLNSGEVLRCGESLAELERELFSDPRFYRCHKGYLVNMDYIQQVEDVFLLSSGHRVPYRVREKKKITDDYYRYFLRRNLQGAVDTAQL